MDILALQKRIQQLKREKNAVILAHNYQRPEIYDVADFIGDSLELAQQAAKTKAEVIVFCGVRFMAETAAILCPDKTVLLPDLSAGCSLAETINAKQLKQWQAEHPGSVTVMYVNTSAEVKALADYCCTSSNAVRVVQSIPADKEILFGPDMFLGAYVQRITGRTMHIWPGECHVHAGFRQEHLTKLKIVHPKAELILHPECGCVSQCLVMLNNKELDNAKILSTGGMMKEIKQSPNTEFIIGTETGIIERMKRTLPTKQYIPLKVDAVCKYMKMITLDKVLLALENNQHIINVPEGIRIRAKKSIDKMLKILPHP
ncbi:MAG: quinolinate synthase NadA [Patescibacteria group bacterium]|jgi:quinolinate synthase